MLEEGIIAITLETSVIILILITLNQGAFSVKQPSFNKQMLAIFGSIISVVIAGCSHVVCQL